MFLLLLVAAQAVDVSKLPPCSGYMIFGCQHETSGLLSWTNLSAAGLVLTVGGCIFIAIRRMGRDLLGTLSEQDVRELSRKVSTVQVRIEDLESELNQREEKLKVQKELEKKVLEENAHLKSQVLSLTKRAQGAANEVDKLKSMIKAKDEVVMLLEKEMKKLQKQLEDQKQLEVKQVEENSQLKAEVVSLTNLAQESAEHVVKLKVIVQERDETLDSLAESNKSLNCDLVSFRKENQVLVAEIKRFQSVLSEREKGLHLKDSLIDHLEKQVLNLSEAQVDLEKKLSVCVSQLEENAHVQAQLVDAKREVENYQDRNAEMEQMIKIHETREGERLQMIQGLEAEKKA